MVVLGPWYAGCTTSQREKRMGLQMRIIGAAFTVFGIVAWITQAYSPAYIGLIAFGLLVMAGSYAAPK
jgi:hypothetical protein